MEYSVKMYYRNIRYVLLSKRITDVELREVPYFSEGVYFIISRVNRSAVSLSFFCVSAE
jgi:hypothetical protein